MNTGNNIVNAFRVVKETYKNLDKFFKDLDEAAKRKGLILVTKKNPKFIRYHSDAHPDGWFISSFIKLYKLDKDKGHDNILFLVRVNFDNEKNIPLLTLARLEYAGIPFNGKVKNKHPLFMDPLEEWDSFPVDSDTKSGEKVFHSVPNDEIDRGKYGGIQRASYIHKKLLNYNADNIDTIIIDLMNIK